MAVISDFKRLMVTGDKTCKFSLKKVDKGHLGGLKELFKVMKEGKPL